ARNRSSSGCRDRLGVRNRGGICRSDIDRHRGVIAVERTVVRFIREGGGTREARGGREREGSIGINRDGPVSRRRGTDRERQRIAIRISSRQRAGNRSIQIRGQRHRVDNRGGICRSDIDRHRGVIAVECAVVRFIREGGRTREARGGREREGSIGINRDGPMSRRRGTGRECQRIAIRISSRQRAGNRSIQIRGQRHRVDNRGGVPSNIQSYRCRSRTRFIVDSVFRKIGERISTNKTRRRRIGESAIIV
ncbi:MAG: hypothetical protein JWM11_1084, partial [Planctomycetaceae bacterium]|nr:hypothetical protein [Planctomycetaceae bacterium]